MFTQPVLRRQQIANTNNTNALQTEAPKISRYR